MDRPQFSAPQADMLGVIRQYCRSTGQKEPDSIGKIARCVYESLALKFRYYFELLERFSGKRFQILHLVGGGTKNRILCQWVADSIGRQVMSGPTEATAIGNLLMQLKADGEIENIEEGRKISFSSSEVFKYNSKDTDRWDEV